MDVLKPIPLAAAALLLTAASLAFGFERPADPRADAKRLFRRPAELADDGQAAKDPVWRIGRRLFFDPALSASRSTSCATCHRLDKGWSDGRAQAVNDAGNRMPFRAPTLLNVGWLDRLGWTGRFADIAAVSLFALNSPGTMNMPSETLVGRLQADASYRRELGAAFGHDEVRVADLAGALVRYVASVTSSPAPFDAWVEGDEAAIGEDAKRGFDLFVGKGRCASCHGGWAFTDGSYHDIGSSLGDAGRGRYFASSVKLQHAFKTPRLRCVADRAPYMHDGSKATLDDVIDLYDQGGIERPSRAEDVRPLHLGATEKADLKAFLATLSSRTEFIPRS